MEKRELKWLSKRNFAYSAQKAARLSPNAPSL
jgi:hypothetical protein